MTRRIFNPHEYQTLIRDFILDTPRCAIWAGMGMGKTSSTLDAVDCLNLMEGDPTLVLAPLRVARDTWPDEVRKWEHLRGMTIVPIVGDLAQRRRAVDVKSQVHTTNYENLPWLVEHWGDRWPYRNLVPDESTRLKSFRLKQGGVRAQALGKVAHTRIKRVVQLSGTPAPNGLADLWGQMWMIDAGKRLGRTHDAFKKRWFQKKWDGYGVEPLGHAQQEIQALLRDVCLTVDPKDYFDLTEPIVTPVYVDLPTRARELYTDMEKRMYMEIEQHEVEVFGAAARTLKCLQIANGAAYVGEGNKEWAEIHDVKLQALESIIEEANGAPVLVAYHFKSDLARLQKAFPHGLDLSKAAAMKAFKTGKHTVGFGHPASMGHGVDGLQEHCYILVYFAHWWDLEQRMQILERIGPMRQLQAGKDRAVWIYNIIARDTVDEDVIARNDSKRSVQDVLLAAMKRKRS